MYKRCGFSSTKPTTFYIMKVVERPFLEWILSWNGNLKFTIKPKSISLDPNTTSSSTRVAVVNNNNNKTLNSHQLWSKFSPSVLEISSHYFYHYYFVFTQTWANDFQKYQCLCEPMFFWSLCLYQGPRRVPHHVCLGKTKLNLGAYPFSSWPSRNAGLAAYKGTSNQIIFWYSNSFQDVDCSQLYKFSKQVRQHNSTYLHLLMC